MYTKQKEDGYFDSLENVDNARFKFEVMLADKYKGFPNEIVFSQPKLDGTRCVAKADGLWSRAGKQYVSVPHIEKILAPVFEKYPHIILDGELYNHELKDNFNEIISLVKKTKPELQDFEKSELSFSKRNSMIKGIFREFNFNNYLVEVETLTITEEEELDKEYSRLQEEGYEGQIIRLNSRYENKRTKSLLKRKEFQDAEFTIVSLEEGIGNWSGYAKKVFCEMPSGQIFGAGIKGDQKYTRQLLEEAEEYKGGIATIKYQNLTPDGIPRFPIAVALYKGAREY